MALTQEVFRIDCRVVVPRIEAFIRERMDALSRKGILVPLSGGLDSSTVAELREIRRLSEHMRQPSMSLDPLTGHGTGGASC